jgi:transcriptional regulator with XRE-family HTH domain
MEVLYERVQRGKELRDLRKQKGVTQAEMAKLSGVSLPSIIRMEKAKKNWRIDLELIFRKTLEEMPDKATVKKK